MREYNRQQENEMEELIVGEAEEEKLRDRLEKEKILQEVESIFIRIQETHEEDYEELDRLCDKFFNFINKHEDEKNDIYLYIMKQDFDVFERYIFSDERTQGLNKVFANKIGKKRVANNLEKFKGLNHQEIANKLIESGEINILANNLEKFKGLNHQEIANKLIESGEIDILTINLEKFQNLNIGIHQKLANKLIGFNGEDKKFLIRLFADNLEKFQNLNSETYQNLPNKLIESGGIYALVNNLEKFKGLDNETHINLANKLIESKGERVLANNLEKFKGLDNETHINLANKLIESKNKKILANNLEKFKGLDNETHINLANKLIESGKIHALMFNMEKFQGLNHEEIASKLIESGNGSSLIDYLEKFEGGLKMVSQTFQQNAQTNFGGKKDLYQKIFETQTPPHDLENQLLKEFLKSYASFLEQFNKLKESENISEEDKKYLESGKLGEEFLIPVCNSQSVGSFRFLGFTSKLIESGRVNSEKDFSLLSEIAIKQGTKATETMDFLVKQYNQNNESLSENKNLREFIFSGLPTTQEIYKEYISIVENDSLTDLERKTELNNLQEKVLKIQGQIIEGGGEDAENKEDEKILTGLVYDVFPPASSIGREEYENLLRSREDRTKDIPQELMDLNKKPELTSVYKKFGFWNLKEGEKVDSTLPKKYIDFIDKINTTAKEKKEETKDWRAEYVKLAQQLLRTKKIKEKEKDQVFQDIYTLIASGAVPGVAGIESGGNSFEDKKQLLDLIGDKFKDAIDIALKTYKEENPEEYEKDVDIATKLVINKKAKKGIVKSMVGVLKQYTRVPKHKIFDEDTDRFVNSKIKRILKKYNIHFEGDVLSELVNNEKLMESVEKIDVEVEKDETTQDIKARMKEETKQIEQILKEYFQEKLLNAEMNRNAGKLSSELVGKFFGEEKNKLQDDISKYEFVESGEGSGKSLRLEISKRKLHSVAGLNMGVCVAIDEKLWDKETFMNVILWDDEIKKAQGGMHFEIVEDKGEKYLSLPGINPTPKLLASANPESIYDQMLEFAKASAKAIGAKGVLIPKREEIYSNRAEIHKIVKNKKYPDHSLENKHDFSYKPYPYSWQDAYFVEV